MLSFTSHRSGSVALVAAKMGIPDKFSAMVSPGEPGPVVHAALLISQWGSVQSALCLFSYFPSLSPPSLPPPFPSPAFPFLSFFVDWVSSSWAQSFGFLHHRSLLLTSMPDFWVYPSSSVLRSLVTCMRFNSGKEVLLSWDTDIMGAKVSHPEPPLSTAGIAVVTQPSNSLLRNGLIWKASLCPGLPTSSDWLL